MKLIPIVIAVLLLAIPAMAAETKEVIGEKFIPDIVVDTNVSATYEVMKVPSEIGEVVVKNLNTKSEISVASTKTGIKADKLSDYFGFTKTAEKAVFHSWATNLGKSEVGVAVYEKDIKTGDISMVKKGARFPAITPNGKYIVYEYAANYDKDLPALYVYNTETKKETFVAYTSGGNDYGWQTQAFRFLNNDTVYYNTSYPYPDVHGGFQERFYVIGGKV